MTCLHSKLFEANFSSFVPLYKITERKVFFTKEKTNNFGRFSSILANNFRKKIDLYDSPLGENILACIYAALPVLMNQYFTLIII